MVPWFLLDILRDCGKKVNVSAQNYANVALDFVRGCMDNTHKNSTEKLWKVEKACKKAKLDCNPCAKHL